MQIIFDSATEKGGTSTLMNSYFKDLDTCFPESVALIPKVDLAESVLKSGFLPVFDPSGQLVALNSIFVLNGATHLSR